MIFPEFIRRIREMGLEYFGAYYGIYQATVVDNADPLNAGRLKIKCLQLYGETIPDIWIKCKGLASGKGYGVYIIPRIGDTVWIKLELGNLRYPVWEHGYYAPQEAPMVDGNISPNDYLIKTLEGSYIYFNAKDKYIRLQEPSGKTVEINNANISLGSKQRSAQPGVLGDTNEEVLLKLCGENIKTIAYLTAYAAAQITACSALPILIPLVPGLTTLQGAVTSQNATLNDILALIPKTKSLIVSLD